MGISSCHMSIPVIHPKSGEITKDGIGDLLYSLQDWPELKLINHLTSIHSYSVWWSMVYFGP
jgi:hypothetical protein